MKDWMIRAGKTFIQAFLGVLVPEICAMLSGALPADMGAARAAALALLPAALAAGISAVWNLFLEKKG